MLTPEPCLLLCAPLSLAVSLRGPGTCLQTTRVRKVERLFRQSFDLRTQALPHMLKRSGRKPLLYRPRC